MYFGRAGTVVIAVMLVIRRPIVNCFVDPPATDSRWYAVRTRSRQEKAAAATLTKLRVQNYLPLVSQLRQWSDRKQTVELPLFGGYLFVRSASLENDKLQVLKVPGIVGFVGNQGGSLPVPDEEIEAVQKVLSIGASFSLSPVLEEGDRVRVVRGALSGVEGRLAPTHSASRLVISIDMIHQSISVNVSRTDVELIRKVSDNPTQVTLFA